MITSTKKTTSIDYENGLLTVETLDHTKENRDIKLYNPQHVRQFSIWIENGILSGLTIYHSDELSEYDSFREDILQYAVDEFSVMTCSITPIALTVFFDNSKISPVDTYAELKRIAVSMIETYNENE